MHWSSIAEPFAVKIHVSKCHVTKRNPSVELQKIAAESHKTRTCQLRGFPFSAPQTDQLGIWGTFQCRLSLVTSEWVNIRGAPRIFGLRPKWPTPVLHTHACWCFFAWLMELLSDSTWQVPSTATLGPLLLRLEGIFARGYPSDPSGNLTWPIYRWFTDKNCWFSIAICI